MANSLLNAENLKRITYFEKKEFQTQFEIDNDLIEVQKNIISSPNYYNNIRTVIKNGDLIYRIERGEIGSGGLNCWNIEQLYTPYGTIRINNGKRSFIKSCYAIFNDCIIDHNEHKFFISDNNYIYTIFKGITIYYEQERDSIKILIDGYIATIDLNKDIKKQITSILIIDTNNYDDVYKIENVILSIKDVYKTLMESKKNKKLIQNEIKEFNAMLKRYFERLDKEIQNYNNYQKKLAQAQESLKRKYQIKNH